MARKPSAETELRNSKAEVRRLTKDLASERSQRRRAEYAATKAVAERDEWKGRFDELLKAFRPNDQGEGT